MPKAFSNGYLKEFEAARKIISKLVFYSRNSSTGNFKRRTNAFSETQNRNFKQSKCKI
jgi:hypothetical protein